MPITAPRLQQFDMTDYINALLNSRRATTNDNYGRARTDLSNKATQGRQAIGQSYQDFVNATNRSGADYNAEAARINTAIANANRSAEAGINATNAKLQADLRNQGADTTALGAATGNQLAAAQNQGALEAALAQRLQQVAGQQARDTADSGAMVRQGAEGTLTNNESDVLARILQQQNQELGDIETQGQGLYMENQKSMADQARAQQAMDFEAAKFNASEAAQARRDAMQAQLQREAAARANPNADLQRKLMELQVAQGQKDLAGEKGTNPAALLDDTARSFAYRGGDLQGAAQLIEEEAAKIPDQKARERWRNAYLSQVGMFYGQGTQANAWNGGDPFAWNATSGQPRVSNPNGGLTGAVSPGTLLTFGGGVGGLLGQFLDRWGR